MMHQHIASSRPLTRLLVASVLGLALVSLVGLGVGFSVQAQQPDEVDITGIEGQAVSSAATRYRTLPVSSFTSFYETATISGSATIPLTGTVEISPTITVCGNGRITVTVRYTASGSIPVSIEGANPTNANVNVSGTSAGYSPFDINGWKTIAYKVNRNVYGSVDVTGTGPVTVTGSGPVGGETGVLIEGDLKHCLALPVTIHTKSYVVFYDDFSDPNSGWPSATSDICSYRYKDGRYEVKVYEYNERCIVPAFPVPPVATGTYSLTVRRTTSTDWDLMYGFFWAQIGSDALKNHWALEVRPDPVWDDEPFFWLSATVDDEEEFFKDVRTEKINTGRNEWNNLKVTRDGSRVKVYINGSLRKDEPDDYLHGPGYFDLEVISLYPDTSTDNPVIVQFDDFTVLSNIE
jgi:hypothetical protein